MPVLLATLLVSIFIQAIFFILAVIFKTDKVTDLSYGLSFIFIVIYLIFTNNTVGETQAIVSLMVIFWGIRLISYLFQRILKIGRDKRFDGIRENFKEFLRFWIFQAIAVWIISLPSILIISKSHRLTGNSYLFFLGILMWAVGIAFETIADKQKYDFKNDPKNADKWIETGVWKYSRHPNYFGEIMLWWGIYIIALPHLNNLEHLAIMGPIFITSILLFVSGIPPLEKKYDLKYKDNEAYQLYKKTTSILIPLPKIKK